MRVFIFGAGASRGSQDHPGGYGQAFVVLNPGTSPLVNELFEGAYSLHGEFIGLTQAGFDEVRQGIAVSGGSVENWLTAEWERIGHLQHEAAKQAVRALFGRFAFYLWSLFLQVSQTYQDENGYRTFVDKLIRRDERFGLISFNYDLLLDRAIQDAAGHRLVSLDAYFAFNYIKPHGSANWFFPRRVDDPPAGPGALDVRGVLRMAASRMFSGSPFDMRSTVVLPPDFRPFLQQDISQFLNIIGMYDWGGYFYPLIFMPLTIKEYGIVARFQDTLERAKAMIAQADEVYLIGYRAADLVVRELLANPPVRSGTLLYVVGRDEGSATEILERVLGFSPAMRAGGIFGVGFMRFVQELL